MATFSEHNHFVTAQAMLVYPPIRKYTRTAGAARVYFFCLLRLPPQARFHDLRNSYAVVSLKSGDDVKTVQENLGHATAAFTLDVYGHVTEKMKKDSTDRMQAFIKSVS